MELGVLGELHARAGGSEVPLRPVERRILCALAVLRPSSAGPDTLADAVWGQRWPVSARHSIQAHVGRLRASVGRDVVVSARDAYRLGTDVWVDIDAFVAAQAEARSAPSAPDALHRWDDALALWRGRPFDDLGDWPAAATERARLVELWHGALEGRLAAALEVRPDASLVAMAEELAAAEPIRETRWVLLMRALDAVGRQGEALRAFDRARRVLASELGISPGSELTLAYEALIRPQPASRPREGPGQLREPTHPELFPPVRSSTVPVGNLPWTESLVGRAAEVEAVSQLLQRHRLVTVTGPGGVGKTRLALAAAHAAGADVADGCWFVDLASSTDPVSSMAGTVPMSAMPATPRELARQIGSRDLLVVLDNCEHMIDEVADLVLELLAACPVLRLLCTSQEALEVDGERVWPLTPLGDGPAVELFAERARAVRPDAVIDHDMVGQICRHLDGLPLAIEMAAARVATMSVGEIAERLDERFGLLGGHRRGAPARHRGLATMVDWSHELLDETAQRFFRRLGIFAGSFTRGAAVAIAGEGGSSAAPSTPLDLLVRRSLVLADTTVTPTRYRLLETLRLYALERLGEAGERQRVGSRHARWYADWAAGLGGVHSPDEVRWLAWAVDEFDNLRTAVAFAIEQTDTDLAVRLVGRLWPLGVLWRSELLDWAQRALAMPGAERHPDAAGAHLLVASLAWITGDVDTSERAVEDALRRPLDEWAWTRAVLTKRSLRAYRGQLEDEEPLHAHRDRVQAPENRVMFDCFLLGGEAYRARPSGVDPARLVSDADRVGIPGLQSFARTMCALSLIPRGHTGEAMRLIHEALDLAQPGLNRWAVNIAHEVEALAATDEDGLQDQAARAVELARNYPMGLGFALIGLIVTADRHHHADEAALLAGYVSTHLTELALPSTSAEFMAGKNLGQFVTAETSSHYERGRTLTSDGLCAELERLAASGPLKRDERQRVRGR